MNCCKIMATGLFLLSLIACNSHSSFSGQAFSFAHSGAEWLSWSKTERENFVFGYVDGYEAGVGRACSATDDLFDKDKPRIPGYDNVPSTFPSARCRAFMARYTAFKSDVSPGPDVGQYVDVITEFYTKRPEYRNIPFEYLMDVLAGNKAKTADDLYSMAKSGTLKTDW